MSQYAVCRCSGDTRTHSVANRSKRTYEESPSGISGEGLKRQQCQRLSRQAADATGQRFMSPSSAQWEGQPSALSSRLSSSPFSSSLRDFYGPLTMHRSIAAATLSRSKKATKCSHTLSLARLFVMGSGCTKCNGSSPPLILIALPRNRQLWGGNVSLNR